MPRYIDAEKAESVLYGITAYKNTIPLESAIFNIRRVPTADVVEVVRCKDCEYNPDTNDDDQCPFVESDGHVKLFPEDDFFCKYGERKETLTTKA